MQTRSFFGKLVAVAGALAPLSFGVASAEAQRFYEVAGGWNAVAQAPSSVSDRYNAGPFLRASVGSSVVPRTRIRFDGDVMLFQLQTERPVPCPSQGCPHPFYDNHTRAVAAFAANGLFALDSREHLYLIAGLGVYDIETQVNSKHIGASAGVGLGLPGGLHNRVVIEATWHGLVPSSNGPRWLAPVSLGFRF
jgi:hypothetical protein